VELAAAAATMTTLVALNAELAMGSKLNVVKCPTDYGNV